MKQKIIALSREYTDELGKHVKRSSSGSLQTALELGRKAEALGLETLEIARLHERALVTLNLETAGLPIVKRAQIFFAEAITPLVENHRISRENKTTLKRLNDMLGRCTVELSDTNKRLKVGVVRRKSMEAALKKNGEDYTRLLADSRQLQDGFRKLTHEVMAAQEEEKRKLSRELQDEIAQTLLGINVRLVSLKKEARGNTKGLKNEIATTRRIVAKSAKSVRVVAKQLAQS